MAYRQTYKPTGPDGGPPEMLFYEWIGTLTVEEQNEVIPLWEQNGAKIQNLVDQGLLVIDESVPGQYTRIWIDEQTMLANDLKLPPDLQKYWTRWQTEYNVTTTVVFEGNV